jgi:predicted RNase H-like HicB family nuclease
MLTAYIEAAMHKARYEILPEDGSFYGEIPECTGVFANADSLEACRDQLQEVLEDWILLRIRKRLPLPTIDGIELSIQDVA